MKTYTITLFAAAVSAHSWLSCTNHDNSQIRGWMERNSTMNPHRIVDPIMPEYAYLCKGWPRGKKIGGNWIEESTNYVWNLAANKHNGIKEACHPSQRVAPDYKNKATPPIATVKPGGSIKLQFGGNGHTNGGNVPTIPGEPKAGRVIVYWKGEPRKAIEKVDEFNDKNKLHSADFAGDSFSYKAKDGMFVDKGNWMNVPM